MQIKRYGGAVRSGSFEHPIRHASASDMAALTTLSQFIGAQDNFSHIEFQVRKPAWVSAFHVSFYRYVDARTDFVEEVEDVGPLGDHTTRQVAAQGLPVGIRIHGITTSAGPDSADPFIIQWAAVNP